MTDYIKREDAIKAVWKDYEYDGTRFNDRPQIAKAIITLPSADVIEPKRGEWEEREIFCVADDNPIITEWQSARCSKCNKYHTTPYMYYFSNYNFCPNCGADMRGGCDEING